MPRSTIRGRAVPGAATGAPHCADPISGSSFGDFLNPGAFEPRARLVRDRHSEAVPGVLCAVEIW